MYIKTDVKTRQKEFTRMYTNCYQLEQQKLGLWLIHGTIPIHHEDNDNNDGYTFAHT